MSAVGVGRKAAARRDAILVDDAQRPEADVLGIVVMAEREAVFGVEPAESWLCRAPRIA